MDTAEDLTWAEEYKGSRQGDKTEMEAADHQADSSRHTSRLSSLERKTVETGSSIAEEEQSMEVLADRVDVVSQPGRYLHVLHTLLLFHHVQVDKHQRSVELDLV
jgi:hypothetical protein